MFNVQNKVISYPQEICDPLGFGVLNSPKTLPHNYFTEIFFMKGGYCINQTSSESLLLPSFPEQFVVTLVLL